MSGVGKQEFGNHRASSYDSLAKYLTNKRIVWAQDSSKIDGMRSCSGMCAGRRKTRFFKNRRYEKLIRNVSI